MCTVQIQMMCAVVKRVGQPETLIVNRSTTMCRCRDAVTELWFHFVMPINASFHSNIFLFLAALHTAQTVLTSFFFVQIQFVIQFRFCFIRIRLACSVRKWCDVVWSGERNLNRRWLSLHIVHDQILIYIHPRHTERSTAKSGSCGLSNWNTNLFSCVRPLKN